jgi:hypothetical protein
MSKIPNIDYIIGVKRPQIFFLALLPALLAGCSSSSSSLYRPKGNDKVEAYIDTRGENLGASYDSAANSYLDYLPAISADRLIREESQGTAQLVFLVEEGCSACESFQDVACTWLTNSLCAASVLYYSSKTYGLAKDTYAQLANHYAEMNSWQTVFPSLYLFSGGTCTNLDFWANNRSPASKFASFVNQYINVTEIYRFAEVAKALSFRDEKSPLIYLYDSSNAGASAFYEATLYPLAKKSEKPLLLLDYAAMDADNQALALAHFSYGVSYEPSLWQKNAEGVYEETNVEKSPEEGAQIVTDYYA